MAALAPLDIAAAPYRPTDDALVLERVPTNRQRPAAAPNLDSAAQQARDHIERARADGDPRWLGYAEGVLKPWWTAANPPPAVRLLRAILLQSRHRFDEALADLDAVPESDAAWPQAQLTRATVLRVQGRYAEAATSCAALMGRTDDFAATLCETAVKGLRGQLPAALDDLRALKPFSLTRPLALQAWYAAELAEALDRHGDTAAAEQIYREALGRGADLGLRITYADQLLAEGRATEVEALVRDYERVDALALRLLLAQQAQGRVDAALQARIVEAYAAARRRGEAPHLREETLFTLHIRRDAPRALMLAQQNWAEQREPADTRLLVAAAQAAQQPEALRALREWQRTTGYEDARLKP